MVSSAELSMLYMSWSCVGPDLYSIIYESSGSAVFVIRKFLALNE